jgi:hypothetical protein
MAESTTSSRRRKSHVPANGAATKRGKAGSVITVSSVSGSKTAGGKRKKAISGIKLLFGKKPLSA